MARALVASGIRRLESRRSGLQEGQEKSLRPPATASGAIRVPQLWQKRWRSPMREAQTGQSVLRSLSPRTNGAEQKVQSAAPATRGAPQEAQRTTGASCALLRGTASTAPHRQRKRSPTARSPASNCLKQLSQRTRRR
jgi:hypothetical protein